MRIRRTPTLPAGSQSGLDLQLLVKCPGCGARLSLEEGARAVRCAGCREPYLVPPWQYPFAAVVNPSIDTVEARRIARTYLRVGQHRATAVGRGQWRLLPFWRHRSAAFQWLSGERHGPGAGRSQSFVEGERENGGDDDAPRTTKAEFHDLAVQRLDLLFPAAGEERAPAGYQPPSGVHAAYPLNPNVTVGATLEPVAIDFTAARESAREEVERRCASGDRTHVRRRRMTLVGEEMVLIYLPFFMLDYHFRDEIHEVVVDGVAGTVATHRLVPDPGPETGPGAQPGNGAHAGSPASGTGSGSAVDPSSADAATAEARARETPGHAPLLISARCPACTATIEPRSPAARVHGCEHCGSAWETAEGRLRRVDQHLAVTEAGGPTARYLPFWKLAVAGEAAESAVYVPAFEAWQVERLGHLGVHLTRAEPFYDLATPGARPAAAPASESPSLSIAVSLGRDDAERLAWVVLGSIASASPQTFEAFLASGGIAVRAASLLWLPFRPSGLYLRENVSGAIVRDLPVEVEMPVLESDSWTSAAEKADKRTHGPSWPTAA